MVLGEEMRGMGKRIKKGLAVLEGWVLMGVLPCVLLPSHFLPQGELVPAPLTDLPRKHAPQRGAVWAGPRYPLPHPEPPGCDSQSGQTPWPHQTPQGRPYPWAEAGGQPVWRPERGCLRYETCMTLWPRSL